MPPVRFTMRQLLASTALIALGVALCLKSPDAAKSGSLWLALATWLGGWGLMGAGCGAPFDHKVVSALLGALCGIAAITLLFAQMAMYFE